MDLLFGAGLPLKLSEERDMQGLMTAARMRMTARPAWPSGGRPRRGAAQVFPARCRRYFASVAARPAPSGAYRSCRLTGSDFLRRRRLSISTKTEKPIAK